MLKQNKTKQILTLKRNGYLGEKCIVFIVLESGYGNGQDSGCLWGDQRLGLEKRMRRISGVAGNVLSLHPGGS